MIKLNLPEYQFHILEREGKPFIFDQVRKKYVALTPEEWVRQHFYHFLTLDRQFPKSLIVTEKKVLINGLSQRFDMLVFDRKGNPLLIAEFKSPGVAVNQTTFHQASRYNGVLKAPYCLVSNGINHFLCKLDFESGNVEYLQEIPEYNTLATG